jgi:serine phosphatase RsbU (regulator of sigma subunit)
LAEQEVERPSRAAARPAAGRGGMGLGAKVGLVTALVTAAVLAAAVLPGRGGDGGQSARDESTLQEAGLSAVSVLAAIDSSYWLGGGGGDAKPLARLKKSVEDLFGERIARSIEEAETELKSVPKDEDAEEREERGRRLKKFEEALERLERGGGADASGRAKALLTKVPRDAVPGSAFQAVAAWVREGRPEKPGAFVAGSHMESALVYDASRREGSGSIFWAPGVLNGTHPMRVFAARSQGKADATVFVGIMGNPAPAKEGGGMGLVLLLVGPILVGLAGFAVANSIGGQVRNLARELDKVGSSGDPHRAIRAQGAEASQVARAVERMLSTIEFRQQQGGGEMADMDAIVERERKLASEIHEGLINKHPPRLSDYEVEHLFKPGFEVGGDHFEYFRIDDDHLGVILLDTNVRGIPAAIVMSAARAYVRAAAPGTLSPADVLKRVNTLLAGELPPGRHVTALYAVVDTAQGKVTLASAGHLPVLVYRQATGKIAKANPAGIALGLDVGPVFDRELQEGDIALGPGDRLVLYTDGALKITNETGEEFGESRFYSTVAREAPKNSQAFVNFVGSAIDSFHLTTPQNDDVTISTIKRLR